MSEPSTACLLEPRRSEKLHRETIQPKAWPEPHEESAESEERSMLSVSWGHFAPSYESLATQSTTLTIAKPMEKPDEEQNGVCVSDSRMGPWEVCEDGDEEA